MLYGLPDDKTVYVLQHYFLPQARVEHLEEKNTNEAPYRLWADRGLLTICDGSLCRALANGAGGSGGVLPPAAPHI